MSETEAQFSSWVEDALTLYGWRWYHSRPARTARGWVTALSGSPGFPDIVAVRDAEVIFAELKTEKGRLGEEQKQWLGAFNNASYQRSGAFGVYVWRPSDRERILEILGPEGHQDCLSPPPPRRRRTRAELAREIR